VKKILILTASYGEGHNSAARGVRDGLARIAPHIDVDLRDLFAETYGAFNDVIRKGYLGLINRWPRSWGSVYRWLDRKQNFDKDMFWFAPLKNRLARLLVRFDPDAIVSVFPAYPYLLNQILGPTPRSKNVVVVTDSITVNAIWYRCRADYLLVPNEQSAVVVRAAGIAPERIKTFGFPVNPVFADLAQDRQWSRQEPSDMDGKPERVTSREASHQSPSTQSRRVLYMINASTLSAPETVRQLLALDLQLTVTVGRDEKLGRAIAAIAGDKIDIVGWTDQLPRLLSESHLLIGKAGGATVQETIAARCPMIINHIVSGQEEGNARLIVETNSGAIARSPAEVVAAVQRAFADEAKQWREWEANISRLSRPRAALDIAEFLLSI
jgi:UDP-N-acetylglucosamine:LPS N-acetylglucosamine transferase